MLRAISSRNRPCIGETAIGGRPAAALAADVAARIASEPSSLPSRYSSTLFHVDGSVIGQDYDPVGPLSDSCSIASARTLLDRAHPHQ